MNFVIFDLEATCWEGKIPSLIPEIIEIGAVRMNRYGEVLGVFDRFIKPILNPRLSIFCKKLTSIEQQDVDRSSSFVKVVEDFQDWAEIFYEEYLLCSWGSFDKKMLIQDCQLHDMETEWVEPHLNLKKQYHEIKRLRRTRGLKSSVEREGFEFTGIHHRGLWDAKNLAKLFAKYLDEWRY